MADAGGGQPVEQIGGEMQSGSRRGNRAGRVGINGLIVGEVVAGNRAADVMRQRGRAMRRQQFSDWRRRH